MYLRLLGEAVNEEKGLSSGDPEAECLIDLQISAHIPESYIAANAQRLDGVPPHRRYPHPRGFPGCV